MISPLDAALQFHTEALSLRAQRQQVLASNIANADTPGYQARDFDFAAALKNKLNGTASPDQLSRTADSHISASAQGARGAPLMYRTVVQPSLDGNTVDMDVELGQFSENAIHYEANLAFINSQLKALLAAIQG
jgi:flagellar basal-body rod protein FlgB